MSDEARRRSRLLVILGAFGVVAAIFGASPNPHIVQIASHVYRVILMCVVTWGALCAVQAADY